MSFKIITDYKSIDIKNWDSFVKNHPDGNIFQTHEMYCAYKKEKLYEPVVVVCLDDDNAIVGLLISVIQKEYKGIIGKLSSRSIIWGGPLIKDNNTEILNIILKNYNELVKNKAVYTQVRNLWDVNNYRAIFESNGFEYEDHLNILVDLTKSEDVLWKEIYSRRRSQINKSERKGVEIKIFDETKSIDYSYKILKEVYKRAKLPLAEKEFFMNANEILREKGYLKFFGAFFEGNLIAVMYLLCYKERTYEWYIGCYMDYMKIHPNDLIIWEIFKWSKENGYSIFDFGGAGSPDKEYGVREYKKKFGGNIINLGRYRKIHNNYFMSISLIGFKIWQFIKFGLKKY